MHARGICGLALAVAACVAAPAGAVELRMLSSWDERYVPVRIFADAFSKAVEARTKGEIKITRSGPEVVPFSQQLQPASSGAFDLLFSHGGYHPGSTGVGVVLDAITPTAEQMRSSGIWDFVDKHYQQLFNLRLVSAPIAGSVGYQFLTKKPMTAENMKGFKLRATNSADILVKALGASRVVMPPEETYAALEKGVIEGTGWAMLGALDYKWYEVVGYYVRPAYGRSTHLLFVNGNSWRKLTPEQQAIMLEEGAKIENSAIATFDKLVEQETAELEKRGMKRTDLTLSQEETNRLSQEGMWANALTAQRTKAAVEELRALALKHQLTN